MKAPDWGAPSSEDRGYPGWAVEGRGPEIRRSGIIGLEHLGSRLPGDPLARRKKIAAGGSSL
eukprot:7849276-Pyramimonas_sp.AAC.1